MAGSFETAWPLASTISGWLSEGQGRALAEAAGALPTGSSIVEIGSPHGRSTVILAHAKPPGARLVAVDPFDDPRWGGGSGAYEVFRGNLSRAGAQEGVEAIRGTSE